MKIGILGGSGLYDWDVLADVRWITVETPWGDPSDQLCEGRIADKTVYFLPRHGRGHRLLPSEINYRANIFALKQVGVEAVLSLSAVGSLREVIRPRDVLVPDQCFDRTRSSSLHTFFGNGVAGHVSLANPVCPTLHRLLVEQAERVRDADPAFADRRVHPRGTYVNIEGPAFSTRSESLFYRQLGFEVIGMTAMPEARLAREAELPFAALSLVTDYDCWHVEEGDVTADLVADHMRANKRFAQAILMALVQALQPGFPSPARHALQSAVMTNANHIPAEAFTRIPWLSGITRLADKTN